VKGGGVATRGLGREAKARAQRRGLVGAAEGGEHERGPSSGVFRVRMLRSEHLFADRQRPRVKRTRSLIVALRAKQESEIVEALRRIWMLRSEDFFPDRQCPREKVAAPLDTHPESEAGQRDC
jgi:hypothetical protein